jgi:hypothetical protein
MQACAWRAARLFNRCEIASAAARFLHLALVVFITHIFFLLLKPPTWPRTNIKEQKSVRFFRLG